MFVRQQISKQLEGCIFHCNKCLVRKKGGRVVACLVCWRESHELNYKVGIICVELHDCMLELYVGDLHVFCA